MKQLTIYFDEGCGICKDVRKFLSLFDFQNQCVFSFAKDMNFDINSEPMQNRYFDMYSYDGKNFYKGYDSYMQIFKRLKIPFYPLYILMHLKVIRRIGEKIYRKAAESRTCKMPTK